MNEIVKVKNLEEYNNLIKGKEKVAIKASAGWCGPCRVLENTLKGLNANELNGTVLAEFDVDEADDVAKELGVRNIPVIFFYKDGEQKDKIIGNVPANDIYTVIRKL